MAQTVSTYRAALDKGIAYEGLRESIVLEMSKQNALADKYGETSELGREHSQTRAKLARVLRHLTPSNTAAMEIADVMLDALRSQRTKHSAA